MATPPLPHPKATVRLERLGTYCRLPGWQRGLAGAVLAAAGFAGWMPGVAHAEVAAADPIDTAMQRCLARADRSSTVGQVQCISAANSAWQGAIDAAYPSLLAHAPAAKQRRGWQDSQKRWLAWRKDELYLVHAMFATRQGTAYAMSEANLLLQPVRDRALALRSVAAQYAQREPAGEGALAERRAPPCSQDAACKHADADLNRYYRNLRSQLPVGSRPALVRAQRAWLAFRDATMPLISASNRVDLIGARIATLKRFAETAASR